MEAVKLSIIVGTRLAMSTSSSSLVHLVIVGLFRKAWVVAFALRLLTVRLAQANIVLLLEVLLIIDLELLLSFGQILMFSLSFDIHAARSITLLTVHLFSIIIIA